MSSRRLGASKQNAKTNYPAHPQTLKADIADAAVVDIKPTTPTRPSARPTTLTTARPNVLAQTQTRAEFRRRTGLFLWKTKPTSRPEVDVFRSYTAASTDGCQPSAFVLASSPDISELETPRSRAYNSQLPLTVLLAYSKWQCTFDRMPLALLDRPDSIKWLEGAYQLKVMGLLTQTNNVWALTDLGARTIDWLPRTRDWQIACLLAHIRPRYQDPEKRVIVRLAAIIEREVPIDLTEPMSTSLMKAILAKACGPAASMVDYGDVWVALSLWESARRESDNFNRPGKPVLLGGRIKLRQGPAIYHRVGTLEGLLLLETTFRRKDGEEKS